MPCRRLPWVRRRDYFRLASPPLSFFHTKRYLCSITDFLAKGYQYTNITPHISNHSHRTARPCDLFLIQATTRSCKKKSHVAWVGMHLWRNSNGFLRYFGALRQRNKTSLDDEGNRLHHPRVTIQINKHAHFCTVRTWDWRVFFILYHTL